MLRLPTNGQCPTPPELIPLPPVPPNQVFEKCEAFLRDHLNAENALYILGQAEALGMAALEKVRLLVGRASPARLPFTRVACAAALPTLASPRCRSFPSSGLHACRQAEVRRRLRL